MKKGQSHVEASPLCDKLVFSKVVKFYIKLNSLENHLENQSLFVMKLYSKFIPLFSHLG